MILYVLFYCIYQAVGVGGGGCEVGVGVGTYTREPKVI